ncbi:hypothetical protein DAMA08_017270 [Martiniozyma asiatica (nom. inval.)]|nr:hypothetical protein DAMA08_017270 [Martiniozyma asiatica]
MFKPLQNGFNWARSVVPATYKTKGISFTLVLWSVALDNFVSMGTLVNQDSVQMHFNTSYATASWVLSGYTLTLASFILVAGKLADILGPHNVFFVGQLLIWVCSIISAAVDKSVIAVCVFRALQGIGAAFLVPSSFAIGANYFGHDKKKMTFAVIGIYLALVASLGSGPLIGGALSLTSIGYKAFFYFVFACAFILNILSVFLLVPIERTEGHNRLSLKNINYVGMFFFVAGLLLIILGLTEGGTNWKQPSAYVPLPLGFVVVLGVVLFEVIYMENYRRKYANNTDIATASNFRRWMLSVDLLFPKEVITVNNFLPLTVIASCYYLCFAFVVPYNIMYHMFILNQSALITGVQLIPYVVSTVICGMTFNENFYRKIGLRNIIVVASLLGVVGNYLTSRIDYKVHDTYWKSEFVGFLIFGFAGGTFFNVYFNSYLPNVPLHLQGVATGIYQSLAQVGFTIGSAIVTTIIGTIEPATTEAMKAHFHSKFQIIKYVSYGVLVVIFIISASVRGLDKAPVQAESSESLDDTIEKKEFTEVGQSSVETV